MQSNDMRKILNKLNEEEMVDQGTPLSDDTKSVSVDMPPYDFYRLGILLANKDSYNEKEKITSNKNQIVCYSQTEYDDLIKILKKLGIKFEKNS